jgi:hypothetical protein
MRNYPASGGKKGQLKLYLSDFVVTTAQLLQIPGHDPERKHEFPKDDAQPRPRTEEREAVFG